MARFAVLWAGLLLGVSVSVSFKAPGDDLGNVSKYVGSGTLT